MFIAELTTYGQSVVSSQVTIDGIILISEYVSNINSADLSQAVLDIDACGSINRSNGSVRIIDASSNVYAVRTILFYTLSGSTKKVVAGYSQEESFVLKTAGVLNVLLPFDFSVFTSGFLFATVQSGYSNAAHNTDGVLHIENPDTSTDDSYSVYSKTQVDDLISDISYTAGDGISLLNNTIKTTGIPFGICDSTSTATAFTVTVPGIYKLEDGVCCMVKNGVVTSASGFTLNVNGLGGKPCYTNLAAATRDTTIFNVSYTMLFVYDSTRVSGGCWICYRGYDANTNTIGYQLRTNSTVMTVTDTARYYKLYFTSADGNHWVPASINSTNNATTARAVNQRPIDPFGRIVYTSANTSYAAGANLAATTIWDQYAIALGYSFNVSGGDLTLTTKTPVYVKCAPQSDGSAIMDATTPIVQTLPSFADGKIYILLGVAYDAIHIELVINHPVYYHDGSGIKLWTGSVIPSKTTDLVNDAGFITEDDIPTNVSAFTNDAGYLTSFTETDPTVPNWAKQTNKPIYTLDEVSDGSTRKLSNYELKSNLKEGAYINVDETTMTSTSTNLPTSKAVASYISGLGYITTESDPTVPSWAKQSSKPSYTLDEVSDGSTRKLSNYVPTSRKVNNKALSSDVTLTLDDVADGTNRKIPTVNNATLTIQKNGTTVNTFTANASSNVTANIIVPTDTGDLTNNAGFITSADMSNFVTTNTAQTITAAKTFDNDIIVTDGNNIILNYSDEAIPDDVQTAPADNYAQLFTTTRDELETSGGAVKVPDVVLDLGPYYYTDDTVSSADGAPSFSIMRGNTEVARFASYAYVNKLGSPYDFVSEAYITQIGSHFYPSTAIYATTFYGDLDGNASSATSATNATNATYASYLSNAKLIDGVTFSNDRNITHYTTCSTGASTVAKEVSITGFTLVEGARVTVKFSATNSASNPTLNVNGTGAKAIKYRGTSAVTSSNWYRWQAGDIIDFIYDGTNWLMVGWQTYATNASVASYASYIGNSSANYVAYSNNVASNGKALLPYADASDSTKYVDLGSSAKKWRDLYVDRNAYFGRNGNASVYGNNYNDDLVIKSTVDTGDSTLGNQTSLLTLNPNYLWLRFENSSESNNVITVQKFENGSTGSRVFVNTDYIFLENGTKIVFEYQSSTAASIGRISSRTIDLNNEQVTVPDLELRLNDANSRFIINSNWLEVAYFDRKGLTIKSQSAINNDTCEAIKLTSSETIFNKDVNLVLAKDANTYIYAGDELNGDDYRYWWTNYDQESMSYTGISISMTEETSADSTLIVPIDELSSVTPFGKLIVNTTSSSLGIGTTSVTDSLKSLIESGRINTVENYIFLCFDSSSFPSNIIGVVICAELLTTSEKLMFFIQSDDLELVGYQHNPSQGPYFIVNSLGSGSYSFSNDYNFNYRIIAKTSIKDYVDDKIESRIDQGVTQAEYSTYASQVGIIGANSDTSYPLLFTSSVTSSPSDSIYNNIYTDTSNDLYYNPSANTLTCATFSSNSHISNSSTYSSQTATLSKTSPASIQFYDRTISGTPIVYNQDIIINLPKITYDRNRVTRTDYGRLVINASDQSVSSATTILSPSSVASETYFGTSLGESNSHFTSAYIDDLYVTSSGTSLLSYIQGTTVNNATHATSASYATYIRYASTGSTYQMYASSATVLRPTNGSSVDIGTSSYKYKNVYADFYNGFPIIPFGTCSSSESEDKVVTLSPVPASLTTGMVICVQFSSTNTKSSPTLNVNSLGAKTMYRTTSSTIGTNIATSWPAGSRVLFRYSGSSWSMLSKVDYQTSTASNTNIIPSATNTYDIGSTDYKWQNLYITGGHSSRYIIIDNSGGEPTIRPDTPNYGYLGTSSADWYRIYGRQIHVGSNHVAIPPIAATTNTSLGSIQFLRVAIPASTTTGIVSAGTTLSSSSYTLMLVTASTGYSYLFFRNNTAPSGTWTTLTDMYYYNSGSSTVYTYVLAYKSA